MRSTTPRKIVAAIFLFSCAWVAFRHGVHFGRRPRHFGRQPESCAHSETSVCALNAALARTSSLYTAMFKESNGDVISNIEAPRQIKCLGTNMLLTQHRGDDSITQLEIEFAGQDTYGIKKISSSSPLVLDIGGNIGFFSILTHLLHPKSQVIVFEPSPLTYFFLRLNLALNNIPVLTSEELQRHPERPGVYPVLGGVGASKRVDLVSMSDPEVPKSKSQNGIAKVYQKGHIPLYNLNNFLESHHLSERVFDIVKLDCECCEYRVIQDSEVWLANRSKVVSLTGEIHVCAHLGTDSEKQTLEALRRRGCEFPSFNFDKNSGRFREIANLNDCCS